MVLRRSVLALASIVGLATACATPESGPVIIGGTQTGVTVRYDPAETQPAAVDAIATAFCKAYEKQPIRRSKSTYMPDVVYQAYDCVASMAPSDTATFGTASPKAH